VENLISIIILNYNGKQWLKKLLDSLLCQTYQNFEIILIDNASTDDSVEFINSNYNDAKIKIVKSNNNLGFAGGNNLGIENSSGKYVLLANNDIWLKTDFLEKAVVFYQANNFDVVAPYEKDYADKKESKKYTATIDLFGHPIGLEPEEKKSFYLSGACLFFEKKLYEDSLGLDSNFFMYSEEVDWFWRLNLLKKSYSHIDGLFFHHAGAGTTGSGVRYSTFLWRNQNILQMLLKNYQWFNLFWILPLYFIQNIFEIIFFAIILKPKIAYSYIQGWWFNALNLRKILQKRTWIQKNRLVGDFEIMQKMYLGFAKMRHLLAFRRK
jgi:hypothetical protein